MRIEKIWIKEDGRLHQRWEVFAPPGRRFAPDTTHSQIAYSLLEARKISEEPTEMCPPDCGCHDDAEAV